MISDFRTEHGISHRVSCRALGVSEAWFYKHRTRRPTCRELRRQHLIEAVQEEFDDSGGTYGSPKIWIRLVRQGWRVSVNTVAKIMAELGLLARKVRRRRGLTRPGKRPAAPDFVRRDFTAEAPDLVSPPRPANPHVSESVRDAIRDHGTMYRMTTNRKVHAA